MKTKLTLNNLVLILFLAFSNATFGQTSINIQYFSDSMYTNYCPPPANVPLLIYGPVSGYSISDPFTLQVDFGDGTTYLNTIYQPYSNWLIENSITHIYNYSGIFSLRCIITGFDGNADTSYKSIMVGDNCGNVSGKIYLDSNNDCVYNTGDSALSYIHVFLKQNNTFLLAHTTDNNGNYSFDIPDNFQLTLELSDLSYYGYGVSCPSTGIYSNITVPSTGNDFALNCLPGFDLHAFSSSGTFVPGSNTTVSPGVINTSCQLMNGQLNFILNSSVNYLYSSPTPDNIVGDTLKWNFANLFNNYNNFCAAYFHPYVYINIPTTAQIGDTICFTTIATPITGDNNILNNTYTMCNIVSASLDPNYKEVSPIGNISSNEQTLTYTVHFQNTGNYYATNIFLLDTLDANLDLNTFHTLNSSHPMQSDILNGNVIKFSFPNIMLPDSTSNEPLSHGYVTYSISTKPGLSNGTQIKNTANIYFDYNPAVTTNTTVNTVLITSKPETNVTDFIGNVYPNPAENYIDVLLNDKYSNAEATLYSALGRIIMEKQISQKSNKLNVQNIPAGIYWLQLKAGNIKNITKVVIVK